MFGQDQHNRNLSRQKNSHQTGRHQPDMAEFVARNSMQSLGYDNLGENVGEYHSLATPSSLIMPSLQDNEEDYMAAGVMDPRDALSSSMDAMNNLSLNDINPSIQFLDGHLDLGLYMDGTKDLINNEGTDTVCQDSYSNSYDLPGTSNHSFGAYDSVQRQTNYSDPYGGQGYADLQYADQNYSAQSFSSIQNHPGGFQDYQSSSSSLPDSSYPSNGGAEQDINNTCASDPHQTLTYSQQYSGAFGSSGEETSLQMAPSSSASSRKGYKHRHERIYGLSEEEKKRRNQVLNNEASLLYRERKSKKVKDAEDQISVEEERKRKLLRQYTRLQRQMAMYQQALNTNSLPQQTNTLS